MGATTDKSINESRTEIFAFNSLYASFTKQKKNFSLNWRLKDFFLNKKKIKEKLI